MAMSRVVTRMRLDFEAAALTGVRLPDHVDVLADMVGGTCGWAGWGRRTCSLALLSPALPACSA